MPKARAAAERALAIEPELAEALATLADVEAQYHRDIPSASAAWDRALASDPRHTRARCERAVFSYSFGVWTAERSVEAGRRAVADDPLSAWAAGILAYLLGFAGKHAEAVREGERAVGIDPASFFAQFMLLRALCWAQSRA